MKILKLFLESWRLLNNKKILAVLGIEFLFFSLMAVNAMVSVNFIADTVNELKLFGQEFVVDEDSDHNYLYGSLLLLSGLINKIFKVIIIFAVISFFLFGFFYGIVWKWSANIINKRNLLKDYNARYFFNFYLLTLIWFLIFASVFYLLYNYGFSYGIFGVILIFLFYFVWINLSYFVLDNKVINSFLKGIKLSFEKFYIFIPSFLIFGVLLTAFSYLSGIFNNDFVSLIGSLFGVFIFVWFRIFLMLIVKEFS